MSIESQQALSQQKEKKVNIQMDALKAAIVRAEDAVCQLTKDLEPVLDPPTPDSSVNALPEENQENWCSFAVEINEQSKRIDSLTALINHTIERLQV